MRNVDIEVFLIAKTEVNREEVQRWLEHLNAVNYQIPDEEAATNPALLIALAAKRCYLSFEPNTLNPNVTKVRSDLTEYLDNILKSGHGSVLEHATYSFAIEGVSRVFTAEMNRHRAGVAISEGSMRYIRFHDIPWWMPPSMRLTEQEKTILDQAFALYNSVPNPVGFHSDEFRQTMRSDMLAIFDVAVKKAKTMSVFEKHYRTTEANYAELQEIWAAELAPESKFHGKKQVTSMIRRIVPMGVATGGVWTMNIRAMRHIIAMRASAAAEEEIAYVFSRIAKLISKTEPMLFGDFVEDENGFWVPKYPKV